jgi:hypothetical protein
MCSRGKTRRAGIRTVFLGLLVAQPLAAGDPHATSCGAPDTPASSNLLQAISGFSGTNTLALDDAREQLRRHTADIQLPERQATPLSADAIRQRARDAHLRVVWHYECRDCAHWHLRTAAGYFVTRDGIAATAYHVAEPPRNARAGVLVAMNSGETVLAITEILAANRYADTALVRVHCERSVPLPLNRHSQPGQPAFLRVRYHDDREQFSEGEVVRVNQLPARRQSHVPGAPPLAPERIETTLRWQHGSSGSAILDACGNAIGHVSSTSTEPDTQHDSGSEIPIKSHGRIKYEAASAADVLKLIKD